MTLTQRQRECLELIIRSYEKRGKAPTFREIADRLGVTLSTASRYISDVENAGYISRTSHKTAAMTILKDLDGDPVTVEVNVTIRKVVPSGL